MAGDGTFVVVGAGHAAGRAVEAMRLAGHSGRIVLIGDEPHLPYERPPLSKELLQASANYAFKAINDRSFYDENGIELRLGAPAEGLDAAAHRVTLADGSGVDYDRLLITTGGRVRRLSIPGAELDGIHYLRTLDDSRAIKAALGPELRLVVVGGGFIGLEVAASARLRGAQVVVLEALDRLMGRAIDREVSDLYVALHREHGVDLRLGVGVERFEGTDWVEQVVAADGAVLPADMVVVGIGIDPDTSLAASGGLAVDNGILVDEFCRTSDPDVFAAGDVTNHFNPRLGRRVRLESWQNAQNQGIAAARAMCGAGESYADIPWFWSDQYDANLQISGVPLEWEHTVTRGDPAARKFVMFRCRGDRIVGAVSVNGGRDMVVTKRLMVQDRAVDLTMLADATVPMKQFLRA